MKIDIDKLTEAELSAGRGPIVFCYLCGKTFTPPMQPTASLIGCRVMVAVMTGWSSTGFSIY